MLRLVRLLLMRFALVVLMLAGTSVTADTEIYRCVLEDGTVAHQEIPCPEPAGNADNTDESWPSRYLTAGPPVMT